VGAKLGNPEELLDVPDLTAAQLEALMLKEFPPSMANSPESRESELTE